MSKAEKGSKVKVHYIGTFADAEVFDSSEGREPLEFTLGEGMVIPGFEDAVLGLAVDESKKIEIKAAEAYGEIRDDLFVEVERTQLPQEVAPEVGMQLQVGHPDGSMGIVTVVEVGEKMVKLDANHPLAGKDLNFELTLVEIA